MYENLVFRLDRHTIYKLGPVHTTPNFPVHHTLHVSELGRTGLRANVAHAATCRHSVIDADCAGQEAARIRGGTARPTGVGRQLVSAQRQGTLEHLTAHLQSVFVVRQRVPDLEVDLAGTIVCFRVSVVVSQCEACICQFEPGIVFRALCNAYRTLEVGFACRAGNGAGAIGEGVVVVIRLAEPDQRRNQSRIVLARCCLDDANSAAIGRAFIIVVSGAVLPLAATHQGGQETKCIALEVPNVEHVDSIQHLARTREIAHAHCRLCQRFENLDLFDVVWSLVDVRDVRRALERSRGEVRPPLVELRSAKTFERVHETVIEAILDYLENFDCRGEVLYGRVVLAVLVLHDGEIIQRLCRLVRLWTVETNRHFDDALCRHVGFVIVLVGEVTLKTVKFEEDLFLGQGCRFGWCWRLIVSSGDRLFEWRRLGRCGYFFFGDRDGLLEGRRRQVVLRILAKGRGREGKCQDGESVESRV